MNLALNPALDQAITLQEAEAQFSAYFRPGPELERATAAAAGTRTFDLSVHFRGTDKVAESGIVSPAQMFRFRRE